MMMTKGIGKGITSGDGRAAASGIVQGVSAMGTGVGQGVESVVSGTADGVISVGQGLFSGVKNVGKGIGGAFIGKTPKQKKLDPR
jgi:phage-related protein